MSDDVATKLKERLLASVGKKAVGDGECFALVDKELNAVSGKSAEDFGKVTPTADYQWGTEVALADVKPGDVLQFKDHKVTVRTETDTKWNERTYSRGHHTSVVVAANADGSVSVVEQKVKPNPKKVPQNVIARLAAGTETRTGKGSEKITITVEGTVKAHRPVAKEKKGARPIPVGPAEHRFAYYQPSEGGPKRPPGARYRVGSPREAARADSGHEARATLTSGSSEWDDHSSPSKHSCRR